MSKSFYNHCLIAALRWIGLVENWLWQSFWFIQSSLHWSAMRCNLCWRQLSHSDKTFATQCSHVFCHDCSSKHFSHLPFTCPICSTNFDETGLVAIDLIPSSDKIKALCGLNPSFILHIASRAIDFYNFQTDLACAHDAQELENTRRSLQHQSQQHAFTHKDLGNQLRTLKFQLEAIVSERDTLARSVKELQNRLETSPSPNFVLSNSHSVSAESSVVYPQTASFGSSSTRPEPSRNATLPRHLDSSAQPLPPISSLPSNFYHSNWPQSAPQSHSQPFYSRDEATTTTVANAARRTRIFTSPPPTEPANRSSVPLSPSSPMARISAVPTSVNVSLERRANVSAPYTPVMAPSSAVPTTQPHYTSVSRFASLGNAPPRPETPLLQRLAGRNGSHSHNP